MCYNGSSFFPVVVSNRRKGWNDLKDSIRAVDMVFLPTLVSKLGIQIHFTAEPALSEFVGILDELSVVHRNCGLHNITKSQVIHALFVSSASTELLDTILLEGKLANGSSLHTYMHTIKHRQEEHS